MRTKILAALALLSAVAVVGLPGAASARNGHFGGGSMHFGGGHFGGAHFGGAHFGGARFGGAHFAGPRFGAAPFGGVRVAHLGGPRAWHGGWHGSRWHGRRGWGWPVAGVALGGWAINNYYDGYYDGYYDPDYECYQTARVWTSRGWRWRQVWVCG